MDRDEIEVVLAADVPLRFSTVDRTGFPHVIPLWFIWHDDAFHMTSIDDRPHLRRLRLNPRGGVCIDLEAPELPDGQRPNRQVRAVGLAELFADDSGEWTRRITEKYVQGPGREAQVAARTGDERVVIRLRPARLVAVASV